MLTGGISSQKALVNKDQNKFSFSSCLFTISRRLSRPEFILNYCDKILTYKTRL